MNDRYLFKAKRLDNGEWVQGYYANCLFPSSDINTGHFIIVYPGEYYEICTSTLCQSTGLKDKNGTPIWENDIIEKEFYKDYDACANSEKYVGKIIYGLGAWSIVATRREITNVHILLAQELEFTDFENHCSVIGNIFDNPELLEVEHDGE